MICMKSAEFEEAAYYNQPRYYRPDAIDIIIIIPVAMRISNQNERCVICTSRLHRLLASLLYISCIDYEYLSISTSQFKVNFRYIKRLLK